MKQYDNLSVTNGKEALEKIKHLTLNEPSGYGVYSTQLKDTMYYFIIKKELEELERWRKGEFILIPARHSGKTPYYVLAAKVLDKYMKAFEILKEKLELDISERTEFIGYLLYTGLEPVTISKEEYELLEELMDENKN